MVIAPLSKVFDPSGFVVSFLSQIVGTIGVLDSTLRVPASRVAVAFFVVLGGSAVEARSQLVCCDRFSV
jgi:hypothetical protein